MQNDQLHLASSAKGASQEESMCRYACTDARMCTANSQDQKECVCVCVRACVCGCKRRGVSDMVQVKVHTLSSYAACTECATKEGLSSAHINILHRCENGKCVCECV